MKTIVIYHKADFDGIFCREIARKFLPESELIGWDYGDHEPVVPPEDALYILDLSVPGLMNHPNLVWIDHHKSAIEKYPSAIRGVRVDGVAACRLTWQWFFHESGRGEESEGRPWSKEDYIERRVVEPLAVRLAGEYDIWDRRDERSELFQHGLRSRELSPGDWDSMLSERKATVDEIESLVLVGHRDILNPDGTHIPPVVWQLLESGRVLQFARTKENASIIKEIGFTLQWEGLVFLACNAARYNSLLFEAGLTPEHDACFGFKWTGKDWSVSLYHAPGKEHHDLSKIAVKYGGGGHRGACGFKTEKLPFLP